ncbi:MAG: hypothetical protein WAO35_12090 [Terriglobia bacterium]
MLGKAGALVGQLLLVAAVALGQSVLELSPTETVKVPNTTAYAIFEPIKCDSGSNIYAQLLHQSDPAGGTRVTRISPDGKPTVFPPPRLEDKQLGILDFAPKGDGGVLLLTTGFDGHYYVESYGEDGRFASRFSLPNEVDPMQIAVSSTGKVLVSGLWLEGGHGADKSGGKPYAAIFGSDGREEREVNLIEPENIDEEGKEGSTKPVPERAKNASRRPDRFSSVQFASNDRFVLPRLGSDPSIYVVSPDGFETNSFHIATPPESQLHSVKVDGDLIAAFFVKKKKDSTQNEISDVFISVINSQTGDEQERFHHSSPQLGASLACYRNGVFTFLTTGDNGELQIVRATAK